MIRRYLTAVAAFPAALAISATTAFAQRPPSNQGPPQMSLERAWAWLIARPGVIIALLILIAALVYMIIAKRKSKAEP